MGYKLVITGKTATYEQIGNMVTLPDTDGAKGESAQKLYAMPLRVDDPDAAKFWTQEEIPRHTVEDLMLKMYQESAIPNNKLYADMQRDIRKNGAIPQSVFQYVADYER